MSIVKATIMGLENLLRGQNDSLFKNIVLPTGIDKSILVDTILLKCAELEVYYFSPQYMKMVTEHFFLKHQQTFEKWVEGLSVTWNPIENYDRYENWKDKGTDDRTGHRTDQSTASDTSSATGSGETASDVTTYDSGTYKPDGKTTSSSGSSSTASTTGNNESNTTDNGKHESEHDGHIHGNIGVTQAGEMLSNWMEVWRFNIYDEIAELYKDEFCVGVYV